MKIVRMAVLCVLVVGCSNNTGRIATVMVEPPPNRGELRDGTNEILDEARTKGMGQGPPCTTLNATTKKCLMPALQLPSGANWTTIIGEGDPHYVIIEQQAPHRVVAEWRFNIRSIPDQIRAAFDNDMVIQYYFLNKDGFRVGAFEYGYWRQCPPVVEHQRNFLIPGNLDFVADTHNVELVVNYQRKVKNCGE